MKFWKRWCAGTALIFASANGCRTDSITDMDGHTAFPPLRAAQVSGTSSLSPSQDTYLKQGTPNQAQGAELILRLRESGNNRGLVQFATAAIQDAIGNGSLVSATLQLTIVDNGNNWGTTGRPIDLHRLTVPWAEANATWNCAVDANLANSKPDCSGITTWSMDGSQARPWDPATTASTVISNAQTGVIKLDVTGDVSAFISGTSPNDGWILVKRDEGAPGRVDFGSRESASGPLLILVVNGPVPQGAWHGTLNANDPAVGHAASYVFHVDFSTGRVLSASCGNPGQIVSVTPPMIMVDYPGCGTETVTYNLDQATLIAQGTQVAASDHRAIPTSWSLNPDPTPGELPVGFWSGSITESDPASGGGPATYSLQVNFDALSVHNSACSNDGQLTDVTTTVLRVVYPGCGVEVVAWSKTEGSLSASGLLLAGSDGRSIPTEWDLTY